MSEESTQDGILGNVVDINKSPASENLLVKSEDPGSEPKTEDPKPKTEDPKPIYDAAARNRFEFEVEQGGVKYDIAPVFGPLSDERYMKWIGDINVRGTQDGETTDDGRDAMVALFDDIIVEVGNIEYPDGADWKSLIDSSIKVESLNQFLAVAIVEPEGQKGGKLRLGELQSNQTLVTECWFNGQIVQQKHLMQPKSLEWEKKYERIQKKRFREEKIKGLHRRKPTIEFVPQDEHIGELYDEMCSVHAGFVGDVVPLRFKTLVINYIFAPKLDQKSLGK